MSNKTYDARRSPGDLELLLTGHDGANRRTICYENDPLGTLTDDGAHSLPGVTLSDVAFGDYDNDGDLDLAITGDNSVGTASKTSRIYTNDGSGTFTQATASLADVYRSSCAWGDYDNDGDLDLGPCGYIGSGLLTRIYENTGSDFIQAFAFDGLHEGSVTWADVDQDNDLDFFAVGYYNWSVPHADLYQSTGGVQNTAPAVPTGLLSAACVAPGGMELSWNAPTDNQTPSSGLYYCVRVCAAHPAVAIASFQAPMAHP